MWCLFSHWISFLQLSACYFQKGRKISSEGNVEFKLSQGHWSTLSSASGCLSLPAETPPCCLCSQQQPQRLGCGGPQNKVVQLNFNCLPMLFSECQNIGCPVCTKWSMVTVNLIEPRITIGASGDIRECISKSGLTEVWRATLSVSCHSKAWSPWTLHKMRNQASLTSIQYLSASMEPVSPGSCCLCLSQHSELCSQTVNPNNSPFLKLWKSSILPQPRTNPEFHTHPWKHYHFKPCSLESI